MPDGGPNGLGFIRGGKTVNPDEWFFKAHFFQDPVWPGSLGLEAFLQLLKFAVRRRWGPDYRPDQQTLGLSRPHEWIYRGQVTPRNRDVTASGGIAEWDDQRRIVAQTDF